MASKYSPAKLAWRQQYIASGRRRAADAARRKNILGKGCDCSEPALYVKSNDPVCARCNRIQIWLEKENINKTRFA